MEVKQVDLRLSGTGPILAEWSLNGLPQGQVEIKLPDLKRACDNIRDTLNTLNEYVMANPKLDEDLDPLYARYNDLLKRLRVVGSQLFILVIGEHNHLRVLLNSAPANTALRVYFTNQVVLIPAGFICEEQTHSRSTKPSKTDFCDFWMSKFDITNWLTVLYIPTDSSALDSATFKALFAIDQNEWARASEDLKEGFPEYLPLYNIELGERHSWDSVREAWRDMEASDGLVFFFAHSDGCSIDFDGVPYEGFAVEKLFKLRKPGPNKNILFFNTCFSAKGDKEDATSLLSAATSGHFPSFVGTEAQVANSKALLCASHFMHCLCFQQYSLDEAFQSMRNNEKLFPLNLFYSLYGARDFRLDRPLASVAH